MKNYYYLFEANLDNDHVHDRVKHKMPGILSSDSSELSVNSRFFSDTQACFEAMQEDINDKIKLLDISKVKAGSVTSINEQNPLLTASEDDIKTMIAEHPTYEEYLQTWDETELLRVTYTTEEFEEDEPPIINDEKSLLFRYVMFMFEDEMDVPDGKTLIQNASSMVH